MSKLFKLVQSESIEHLSEALIKEGQGRGDSMEQSVKDVVALFKRSLQLFAKCHNIYNKKIMTEEDIVQIGTCIYTGSYLADSHSTFLLLYRECDTSVHGALPNILPSCNHHPKDAPLRRPCPSLAKTLAGWFRADGGAGS